MDQGRTRIPLLHPSPPQPIPTLTEYTPTIPGNATQPPRPAYSIAAKRRAITIAADSS